MSAAHTPAAADVYATIAAMGADLASLRLADPREADRAALRPFGWADAEIDAWFESACEAAVRLGEAAHA